MRRSWKEGDYYLGEWHYHPGGAPVPSSCDADQLRAIALEDRYKCPEPILVIACLKANVMTLRAYVFPRKAEPVAMTIGEGPLSRGQGDEGIRGR